MTHTQLFGKEKDAVECGSVGGTNKAKSLKVKMLKRLREIQKLPYDEYMKKLEELNVSMGDQDYLSAVLLSGEKGYEAFMQKLLKVDTELAHREISQTNSIKEQRAIVKDLLHDSGYVKSNIYGSKTRNEVKLEGPSKLQETLEEIVKK